MAEAEQTKSSNAELLATRLDALGDALNEMPVSQKFNELWGLNAPTLDRQDLAILAFTLSTRIRAVDWSDLGDAQDSALGRLAEKAVAVTNHVPQVGTQGIPLVHSIISFLSVADAIVGASISTSQLKGVVALPLSLYKKSRLASERLVAAEQSIASVSEKLKVIDAAYEAAENLPATQSELEKALEEIESAKELARRHEQEADQHQRSALATVMVMQSLQVSAAEVEKKLHAAYSAATSQGLAQSFAEKSSGHTWSMWWWTFILAGALTVGGLIGAHRFPEILASLAGKPDWAVVAAHMTLSCLSLAPVVWMAWVATKQIGQRFRLAEDYGYKAALARAYEGYKAEAATIDPLLQAQLFGTALGRLDEIPLRLIEADVPGSPLHELMQSKEFGSALVSIPGLRERTLSIFRRNPKDAPPELTKDAPTSSA